MSKLTLVISLRTDDFSNYSRRLQLRDGLDLKNIETIIVDDGSSASAAEEIEQFCISRGYRYLTSDDPASGREFSLSRARNMGIDNTRTQWVCFEDADLVYATDFYQRLLGELNALNESPFNFLTIPAIYLNKSQSDKVFDAGSIDQLFPSLTLGAFLDDLRGSSTNTSIESFAHASSVIALATATARHIGGFDESFEGWGGEDRDFVFRLLAFNNHIEKPPNFEVTKTWKLYETTEFEGWRSLYRIHGDYLARKGFYAFHLHHEKLEWRGDAGKANLVKASEKAKAFKPLFDTRPEPFKPVNVVFGHNPHICNPQILASLDNPLIIPDDPAHNPEEIFDRVVSVKPNSVIMWNPYGSPHRTRIYKLLSEAGISVLVGERGALPSSVYFDKGGLCVESRSYREELWNTDLPESDREEVTDYIARLRFGEETLETQNGRIGQSLLLRNLQIPPGTKILFVPLQLADDTVTTLFSEAGRTFDVYIEELRKLSLVLPSQWVMVYKNHPLAVSKVNFPAAINADHLHVHDLIESSSAVALFNSGVGLISMAFNKKVYYYGPCYYAVDGVNAPFKSAIHLSSELNNVAPIDTEKVLRFYRYLLKTFYSFAYWESEPANKGTLISWRTRTKNIFYREVRFPDQPINFFARREFDLTQSVLFESYRHHRKIVDNAKKKIIEAAVRPAPKPPIVQEAKKAPPKAKIVEPAPKPSLIQNFREIGTQAYDAQRFDVAAKHFTEWTVHEPLNPEAHRIAAEAHDQSGNIREARRHIVLASALLPQNKNIKNRLTELHRGTILRRLLKPQRFALKR